MNVGHGLQRAQQRASLVRSTPVFSRAMRARLRNAQVRRLADTATRTAPATFFFSEGDARPHRRGFDTM